MRSRAGVAAAVTVAGALGAAAQAHDFDCRETVDGRVVREIHHYPAKLQYKLRIRNLHPTDASTALSVTDRLFAGQGPGIAPAAPLTLQPGESTSARLELTVHDQADCEELGEAAQCGGSSFQGGVVVGWESGEAQCRALVICGAEWCTGDPDRPACKSEQSAVPECGEDGHSLGFWRAHPQAVARCAAAGDIDLIIGRARSLADFEGVLWGSAETDASGAPRTELDRLRFEAARGLLAATCEIRVFGARWERGGEEEAGRALLRADRCRPLQTLELGIIPASACGAEGVDVGPADPALARSLANDPTFPTGQPCNRREASDD